MKLKAILLALALTCGAAYADSEFSQGAVRGLTQPYPIGVAPSTTCSGGLDQSMVFLTGQLLTCNDPNIQWDYTNNIFKVNESGGAPGLMTQGGGTIAELTATSVPDGTQAYCTDCTTSSDPCVGGSSGSEALRLNGRWLCTGAGGGSGSGTVSSVGLSLPSSIFSIAGSPVTTTGTLAVTLTGVNSGGIPYFSSTSDIGSSATLTANRLLIGGGAGAAPTMFAVTDDTVPVANGTTNVATAVPNCTDTTGNHLNYTAASNSFSCGTSTSGGSGTVTSVAQTVPGGFSISGSPVTTSGTLAIAANGTSGGVLYYSGATTSASSGALTAAKFVMGGGAGAAPNSSAAGDDGTTVTSGARDFSYSQALYATGTRAISTSVSAGATDRSVDCTSGSSTDKTYTLPTATGSQRIIDILKVDTGTKSCLIAVPSGALNAGTTVTLPTVWFGETCRDQASSQWYCRGQGTVS